MPVERTVYMSRLNFLCAVSFRKHHYYYYYYYYYYLIALSSRCFCSMQLQLM